jgi:hypothetical protein
LLCPACGDTTGSPQPIPIPDLIRTTAGELKQSTPIAVVGLPGVVPHAGAIDAQVVGDPATAVRSQATAAGSFSLTVNARAGDTLAVRFAEGDRAAQLVVPERRVAPVSPPQAIPGVQPVTRSGAAANVLVRGRARGPGGVIGVNLDNGEVRLATAASDGTFQLEIVAAPGHRLEIYFDEAPLGAAWELTAP